jgi:hypothetical protein
MLWPVLKTKIFGLRPAEQKYSPREIEQLAEAIVEYGRMSQQHYGSRVVLVGAGEVAMRLRETTQVIAKALAVVEGTGPRGRNRRRADAGGYISP